ncbi:MAG: hypothetical protein ACLU71_06230 [Blautia hansenii]
MITDMELRTFSGDISCHLSRDSAKGNPQGTSARYGTHFHTSDEQSIAGRSF